jgi:MYXO-CTERM domain-containing protein
LAFMLRLRFLILAFALMLTPSFSRAQVVQPNGIVVPTDDTGGGEMRLDEFFASKGEPIDWRADASATPNTFSPLCGFRATLERVDSGSKFGVGWYNVDPDATVAPTQIFEIVPQNATPGQVFTGDDIRSLPEYAGGLIGFALIRSGQTPAYHYSESHWNIYCDQGDCLATPGHWILSLTYQSQLTPNAWYMGFEDGATSALGWNNDGDYNDSLFFFEGLSCPGSGDPCVVDGVLGECAAGLTECTGTGDLECRQITTATAEICDAIDNDCNGLIDDGDDLCGDDAICYRGRCEPRCGRGEFRCPTGTVCEADVCIDAACAGAACGAGAVCIQGTCVEPCQDVVCPGDQICRLGRCMDPCDGVTCAEGRVCEGGVCVESCECRGCTDGLTCQTGDHSRAGHCVALDCLDVACATGTTCSSATGGACQPLCHEGIRCPIGEGCQDGACVPADAPEEPDSNPEEPNLGGDFGDDSNAPGEPVPPEEPSEPSDPEGPSGLGPGQASQGPSCGCRTPAPPPSSKAPATAFLVAALLALRRRRAVNRSSARATPARFEPPARPSRP